MSRRTKAAESNSFGFGGADAAPVASFDFGAPAPDAAATGGSSFGAFDFGAAADSDATAGSAAAAPFSFGDAIAPSGDAAGAAATAVPAFGSFGEPAANATAAPAPFVFGEPEATATTAPAFGTDSSAAAAAPAPFVFDGGVADQSAATAVPDFASAANAKSKSKPKSPPTAAAPAPAAPTVAIDKSKSAAQAMGDDDGGGDDAAYEEGFGDGADGGDGDGDGDGGDGDGDADADADTNGGDDATVATGMERKSPVPAVATTTAASKVDRKATHSRAQRSPTMPSATPPAASTLPPVSAAAAASNPDQTSAPSAVPGARMTLALPFGGRVGSGAVWGSGHQLFFHAHAFDWKRTESAAASASGSGRTDFKHRSGGAAASGDFRPVEFRWECQFGDTRSLLNAWHTIFANMQHRRSSITDDALPDFLHEQSKRYRAELEAFLEKSVAALHSSSPAAVQHLNDTLKEYQISMDDYQNQLSLLEVAKSIWHLFELMYVDPNENITRQLVDWLQRAVSPPDTSTLTPDSAQWWSALYRMTIQGRVLESIQLIESNASLQYQSKGVADQMVELLARFPSLSVTGSSESDFVAAFESWQNECKAVLDDPDVIANPSVEQFFHLLLGEEQTLIQYADNYYELVVSHLLFRKPTTARTDMPWLAEVCLNKFMEVHTDKTDGSAPALTALDELRRLILQNDLPAALQHANVVIDLRWFMAHLVDLLRHSGALNDASDLRLEFGGTLHEYWLLEYASTLMSTPMWQLAVTYLSACSVFGRSYLRTLVTSQSPLTSDMHALKLVHICDRFGLKAEKDSIYQQMGMNALRLKRFGSAVHWFTLCKASARLTYICDHIIQQLIDARHAAASGRPAAIVIGANSMADEKVEDDRIAVSNSNSSIRQSGAGPAVAASTAYDEAWAALTAAVENTSDVSLSHDLAFVSKYRDLCVLRREIADMEQARSRAIEVRAQNVSPPTPYGGAGGSGGSIFGSSASSAPAAARARAGTAASSTAYQTSQSSAVSAASAVAALSSSVALAASPNLSAYEDRIRSLSRAALEIVVRLIAFRVVPNKFRLTVLSDAVSILERPIQPQYFPTPLSASVASTAANPFVPSVAAAFVAPPLLSVADTHTLLSSVQDVMSSHRRNQWMTLNHTTDADVARIRLALQRTLSQAIQQREEATEQRESDQTLRAVKAAAAAAASSNGVNGATAAPHILSRVTQHAITSSFGAANGGSGAAAGLFSPAHQLPLPLQSAFNRSGHSPLSRSFAPMS